MNRHESCSSNGQPSLSDLMVRFLANRSDAASAAVEPASGPVEPHEVATGFRVDPRTAWTDAVAAVQPAAAPVPNEWSSFVNQPAPAFAVALAAGNFPQRVKDLHPLLAKFDPRKLCPSGDLAPTPGCSGLRNWVERESKNGSPLLAAGVARALGDFDRAEQLLTEANESSAKGENERAALLWHRGESEAALAVWKAMANSPTVQFNRGMALLFTGQPAAARVELSAAAADLPENSGWHSLARLYQAVAEIQAI
jgi:tetratricopeptide (TPR) repeat protein